MAEECEEFLARERLSLARAFVASFGVERGQDALAEALAYAWEHWESVRTMQNPLGYLYRVGQSRSGTRRHSHVFPDVAAGRTPWVEPALPQALRSLTDHQRTAVVLAYAYDWTHAEIATLLGTERTTVQNHIERGLRKLRKALEVTQDV